MSDTELLNRIDAMHDTVHCIMLDVKDVKDDSNPKTMAIACFCFLAVGFVVGFWLGTVLQ